VTQIECTHARRGGVGRNGSKGRGVHVVQRIGFHPTRAQSAWAHIHPRPALFNSISTPVALEMLLTSKTPSTSQDAAARTTGCSLRQTQVQPTKRTADRDTPVIYITQRSDCRATTHTPYTHPPPAEQRTTCSAQHAAHNMECTATQEGTHPEHPPTRRSNAQHAAHNMECTATQEGTHNSNTPVHTSRVQQHPTT
jgi:hypothetical protein